MAKNLYVLTGLGVSDHAEKEEEKEELSRRAWLGTGGGVAIRRHQ